MSKVNREVAESEVQSWLDYKKIGDNKRESYKDNIEVLVNAIMDGNLSLKDDNTFIQALKFPFGEDEKTTTFEFKPRLKLIDVKKNTQGLKPGDSQGMLTGYLSALTGKSSGLINQMDTEDNSIAQSIAIFFL